MNRIILIGNGFDLAHGLKTSYANFIDWYWEKRIKDFKNIHTDISDDGLCKFVSYAEIWSAYYINCTVYNNLNYKDIFNDIIKDGTYVTNVTL